MDCAICGDAIPAARMNMWPWARTCNPAPSIAHQANTQRQHRKTYRKRRDAKARAGRAALRPNKTDQAGGTE